MSDFMNDVAGAALPVAIGLLVLAGASRAVLWAQIDDEAERIAQQYLEPLNTWCLVAAGTYALALGVAGRATSLALVAPLAIGAAAVLLRPQAEPERAAAAQEPGAESAAPDREEEQPTARGASSSPPPATGGLWAEGGGRR